MILMLEMKCLICICRRYIKESERKDLLEHAMSFCVQSFKDLLKKHSVEKRDDNEMLLLAIEIFKAHKKCLKNVSQKESPFSGVLVETYKALVDSYTKKHGIELQLDNVNYIELATKMCNQEINGGKKNLEKQPQLQIGKRNDELGFGGLAASFSKYIIPFSGKKTKIFFKLEY